MKFSYILGIIIIVSTTKISSDNARPQAGAYYVYNQVGLNQQNKLRNLYWYTMGQPILSARKQRTVNFQMKPRYHNAPINFASSYISPMRAHYRNAYDGAISANTLKSYLTSVSVSTTTPKPKMLPITRFQPSIPYDELSSEDSKSCTEKNLTIASKETAITLPHNLRPIEITSNSMPQQYSIPPVTPLPIVPYVSHTYFTLDDVVIPSSSENLLYYKPERKERVLKITPPPPFTTLRTKLTNNLISELFGTDFFDVEKSKDILPTALPTETVKNESKMDVKTTKTPFFEQTLVREVFNIFSEPKTSTIQPEIETVSSAKDEDVKILVTTTLNTMLNDVVEEKFEENPTKIVRENIYTISSTLKTPTSTSFLSLLANKMKIAQNHKKYSPLSVKKLSYSTHPVSTSTTTELPRILQPRKSRRTKTYSRQRKADANVTRLNNYNLTQAKFTHAKILRPTLKSTTTKKPKIQAQNVTEIPSSTPETKRTSTTIRSTPISKSISSTNFTETTALAAESAIMTISNANSNARNLRGSMHRFRKRLPDIQKELVHTTAIPQLPIELYFTKLSKSQ